MTLFFPGQTHKLWKYFMTFVYYAGPGALKGLRGLHDKGEKVSKKALKKLEGIIFPKFYNKVAAEMQDERTTLQSLQRSIDTIITHDAPGSPRKHPVRSTWEKCV